MTDWDARFMELAKAVAQWSKDPSTKTGAVLAGSDHRLVSVGFNGFPASVPDRDDWLAERDVRLRMTVHAEINAILFSRGVPQDSTLYVWPWPPCGPCAAAAVQVGIRRFFAPNPTETRRERWALDFEMAHRLIVESGGSLNLE